MPGKERGDDAVKPIVVEVFLRGELFRYLAFGEPLDVLTRIIFIQIISSSRRERERERDAWKLSERDVRFREISGGGDLVINTLTTARFDTEISWVSRA